MKFDMLAGKIYLVALNEARLNGHEFLMPEHFLYSTLMFEDGKAALAASGGEVGGITRDLAMFFQTYLPRSDVKTPMESHSFNQMIGIASNRARAAGQNLVCVDDMIMAIFSLPESHARYILAKNGLRQENFVSRVKADDHPTSSTAIKYTTNLIELAQQNKLDPLVGRSDILRKTILTLCRRLKNNPLHVGEPGVGKTAIVEGLAQKIAAGDVPEPLLGAALLQLDIAALLAGTRYRGDFEDRLVKLLAEVAKLDRPILYIDEMHQVMGAGAVSSGGTDAGGILKPYLARGEVRFIGSTTQDDFKKHIEKDRAFSRRFASITVDAPSHEECLIILSALAPKYEDFHNVKYPKHVLKEIVELTEKHLPQRFLPDKAIDAMDEVGVYTSLYVKKSKRVSSRAVQHVIAASARVPEKSVSAKENVALRGLQESLQSNVFGQDEAIEAVTYAIHTWRAGLNAPSRPVASLLFVGPTGVGKTELARQLAAAMGQRLLRFDMSEYQEKHAVARLIGSPPGYVGYEEGGLLSDSVRQTPNCVLLLDEIEKAHADIHNLLLQVMDHASLTDNMGKIANFENVTLIMTSNVGAREGMRQGIGFGATRNLGAAEKAVERAFAPEFIGRLDSIVRFNPLSKTMARQIAQRAIDTLCQKLAMQGVTLSTSEAALNRIAQAGRSEDFGAREIIRTVERDIKRLLVPELLFGKLTGGGECRLDVYRGKFRVRC